MCPQLTQKLGPRLLHLDEIHRWVELFPILFEVFGEYLVGDKRRNDGKQDLLGIEHSADTVELRCSGYEGEQSSNRN